MPRSIMPLTDPYGRKSIIAFDVTVQTPTLRRPTLSIDGDNFTIAFTDGFAGGETRAYEVRIRQRAPIGGPGNRLVSPTPTSGTSPGTFRYRVKSRRPASSSRASPTRRTTGTSARHAAAAQEPAPRLPRRRPRERLPLISTSSSSARPRPTSTGRRSKPPPHAGRKSSRMASPTMLFPRTRAAE